MSTTSYSETSTYLLCRRRHFYGYGLSLERIDTSISLNEGKLGHAVLETYYKARLAGLEHDDAAVEAGALLEDYEPSDRRADLRATISTYLQHEPFLAQGYTVLAVEQEFNLQWDSATDSRYPFVVDLILRDPHGEIAVVDHKFIYEFMTQEAMELAPQLPLYIGALRALGYPAHYGIYNMLRTRKIKAPTVQQQLAISFVRPTDTRVVESFRQHATISNELREIKLLPIEEQSGRAHRVMNQMVCNSCAFKELCIGELMGDNTELIKQTYYKERERREFASLTPELELEA